MSEHEDLRRLAEGKFGVSITSDRLVEVLDDLDAARAEVESLRGKLAAVEAAVLDPENCWWHAGGTPCTPTRVIRTALEPQNRHESAEPAPGGVGGRSGGREGL